MKRCSGKSQMSYQNIFYRAVRQAPFMKKIFLWVDVIIRTLLALQTLQGFTADYIFNAPELICVFGACKLQRYMVKLILWNMNDKSMSALRRFYNDLHSNI